MVKGSSKWNVVGLCYFKFSYDCQLLTQNTKLHLRMTLQELAVIFLNDVPPLIVTERHTDHSRGRYLIY